MSLVRSVVTIGGFTMASRLLGFLRDILIAASLGAGLRADAFFVALQLPNLFRRLFAEGAFNAAFVPLFGENRARGGDAGGRDFAEQALAALLFVLVVVVGLFLAGMPYAVLVLAPGFLSQPEKYALAVELSRITFPYLLLISLVSLLSGVLNSLGRFAVVAATQLLFNLCLIVAVLLGGVLAPSMAHALAMAVTVSGILQFVWLILACRRAGYDLSLRLPRLTPPVRRLLTLALPAAVGAGATQIALFVNLVLASLLPSGAISYLFYADRLNQLPMGVIGVALGTALLPTLVREIAAGRVERASELQNRALELGLLLTLPATAALICIPFTLVGVLFERGAFGPEATLATGQALVAYAIGLPAFVMMRPLTAGFHARQDTTTPVRIALVAVGTGIAFSLVLMWPLAHVGLALAISISAWLQAGLLGHRLLRRGHWQPDARLRARAPRILLSCLAMVAALVLLREALAPLFGQGTAGRALALALLVLAGITVYGAACLLTGAARIAELRQAFGRRG
ncbi:MAG: murein biosynthesis integral membrane protein MurJ [Alphaproteobacteria bacterium]|nr:murein biosynthesis integral membrane protein MurJ [Alphaproteobacteria bacterium]